MALAPSEPLRRSSAGTSLSCVSATAARCTAEGKTSLDDWPMFTWSLAWASSPASSAITSLAFMFDEVPEPVWKTSIGNWSSCLPSAISWPAWAIRSAMSESSSPSSPFTAAAVPLIRPSQRITGMGTRSPDTGKLSTALAVSPPHSCCSVTDMGLNLPKLPTGTLAALEGGGAVHAAHLLLEAALELGVQSLALHRAPLHRAHQVAEP